MDNRKRARFFGVLLLCLWSSHMACLGSDVVQSVVSVNVSNALELQQAVDEAVRSKTSHLSVYLSAGNFLLGQPLALRPGLSISLQGQAASGPGSAETAFGAATFLQCASSNISLIERHGDGNLTVSDITLHGCSRPGILVHPGSSARILIDRCYFTNFSRALEPHRVNTSQPGKPAPITASTAALAIHATGFMGSIRIQDTVFRNNWFYVGNGATPTADDGALQQDAGDGMEEVQEEETAQGEALLRDASLHQPSAGHDRRYLQQQQEQSPPPAADTATRYIIWDLPPLDNNRELLLSYAAVLDPGAKQEGPWADDLEAVVSVTCEGSGRAASTPAAAPPPLVGRTCTSIEQAMSTDATCTVSLERVHMVNNTGVATSGLYVMCDDMKQCSISLTDCELHSNNLLWQPAIDPDNLPGNDYESVEWGTGTKLFEAMMPWLTYTYPVVYSWKQESANADHSRLLERFGLDLSHYDYYDGGYFSAGGDYLDDPPPPTLTGRTLGAVVVHQRKSPCPGVLPGSSAMVNVKIIGGEYSGNDGAVFMNTATDWMRLAGGYGLWLLSDLPRHSADYILSGLNVYNHTSGMPAVLLRWARAVHVTDTKVVDSTGSIWLEEIRDSATIDGGYFAGNILPEQRWLYYRSFMSLTPAEVPKLDNGNGIGGGSFQVVMLQMTPLGIIWSNEVTVRNSVFEDNPSYVMGALYVVASDKYTPFKDGVSGKTSALVENTTFTRNYCRRLPPGVQPNLSMSSEQVCLTGERPLYGVSLYNMTVTGCRFEDNRAGGLFIELTQGAQLRHSYFSNNINTYENIGVAADSNFGGGAATFISIGTVGVENCTFINNTSPPGGGAVMAQAFGSINVFNSRFEGNTASYSDGGALWLVDSGGNCKVLNTIFKSNVAGRRGGAMCSSSASGSYRSVVELQGSIFEDNTANILPLMNARSSYNRNDQGGGGAFYCERTQGLQITACHFARNQVFRHAGGGVRAVDIAGFLYVKRTRFEDNIAITGGAMALTRVNSFWMGAQGNQDQYWFRNNSVVDPWAWPETSQLLHARNESIHTPLSYLKPGFGGAIAVLSADLSSEQGGVTIQQGGVIIQHGAVFEGNKALTGGAIGIIRCSAFNVNGAPDPSQLGWYNITASPANYTEMAVLKLAAALYDTRASYNLPYMMLFKDNAAVLGGAILLKDTHEVDMRFPIISSQLICNTNDEFENATYLQSMLDRGFIDYPELVGGYRCLVYPEADMKDMVQPGILFYNNSGSGGGAIYIDGSDTVNVHSSAFVVNSVSPMARLRGSAKDSQDYLAWSLASQPCFGGRGGAMCISGRANSSFQINSSAFIHNAAYTDGGAIHVGEGSGCSSPAHCYKVSMVNSALAGNQAFTGQGGGVCWEHEGIFTVQSCKLDSRLFGSPLGIASDDTNSTTQSVQVLQPQRKPPAIWYQALKWEHKKQLRQGFGSSTTTTFQQVSSILKDGAYSTSPLAATEWSKWNDSLTTYIIGNDSWEGMPYTELACLDWINNVAASGDQDLGSSPYFLLVNEPGGLYTSNSELELNVTIHDWYGNHFMPGNTAGNPWTSQPAVVVKARPLSRAPGDPLPTVSGATEVVSTNGTAWFQNFRIRAQSGPWDVAFTAATTNPYRELIPAQVRLNVRQCFINEYLDPGSHDVCLKCEVGYYNVNFTGDSCLPCPDGAECGFPGDGKGFLVPKDGSWHNNFFSDQILECPNVKSCLRPNRSRTLGKVQVEVWNITFKILESSMQSTAVTDEDSPEVRRLRRALLQQLANTSTSSSEFVRKTYLATARLLPQYMSDQCAEGYTGVLCGECKTGYGWVDMATCTKCPDKALNSLYYTLATLLTFVSLAITIRVTLAPTRRAATLRRITALNQQRYDLKVGSPPCQQIPFQPHEIHEDTVAADTSASILVSLSSKRPEELLQQQQSRQQHEPKRLGHLQYEQEVPNQEKLQEQLEQPPVTMPSSVILSPKPSLQPANSTLSAGRFLSPFSRVIGGSMRRDDEAACSMYGGHSIYKGQGVVEIRAGAISVSTPLEYGPSASIARNESIRSSARHAPSLQGAPSIAATVAAAEASASISAILRITISYLQVLSMIRAIPLSFDGTIDVLLSICSQATSLPGALVSLDCSLPGNLGISKAMARVLLGALAPVYATVAFIILTVLACTLSYGYKKLRDQMLPHHGVVGHCFDVLSQQLLVMVSTIMFFFYPSVSQTLFSIFYCQDVSMYDMTTMQTVTHSLWQLDFGQECYKGPHLSLALALGVPGLALFGLGWPILSAVLVVRHLRKTSRASSSAKKLQNSMEFLADYRSRWIWWESVTLLRQLAIAATVTFAGDKTSAAMQLLIVFFVLIAAVIAQHVVQPYRVRRMGTLAISALCGLLATVYLLLLLSQLNDPRGQLTVSIIVLIVNLMLILGFAVFFVQTYWFGLLEASGLSSLDPDERRSITFHEARSHILAHLDTRRASSSLPTVMPPSSLQSSSSRLKPAKIYNAFEKIARVKNSSVAYSQAAIFVLGNQLGHAVQQVRTVRVSASSLFTSPSSHPTSASDAAKSGRTTQSSVMMMMAAQHQQQHEPQQPQQQQPQQQQQPVGGNRRSSRLHE